jgi:S1-C subfamily serine protease
VILVCALGAGISNPVLMPAQKPASSSRSHPLSAVVQLLAVGVAGQGNERECSATGFFVNEQGYILTNAHVVEEARRCLEGAPKSKIVAKFPGPDSTIARAISCDLVGLDEVHDLAVLKTERPPFAPEAAGGGPAEIPIGPAGRFLALDPTEVSVGAIVRVTGHPSATWQAVTFTGHILARNLLNLSGLGAERSDVLVLDIPLEHGASGSPVCLASGAVVGVVVQRDVQDPSRTVAVSSHYAIELLDRLHVSHPLSPPLGR